MSVGVKWTSIQGVSLPVAQNAGIGSSPTMILIRIKLCYEIKICLGFSVGGMVFSNGLTFFTTTSWTFQFRTVAIRTTTNVIKNCRIHAHLFRIKLNTLLAALNGHFTLKLSQNVQNAMLYNFAEMSPQVNFLNGKTPPNCPTLMLQSLLMDTCLKTNAFSLNTLLHFNGIIAERGFLSETEWNWITSQSNNAKQPVLHPCPKHSSYNQNLELEINVL